MGWSFTQKPGGKTASEIVSDLYTWESPRWRSEVLDVAIKNLRTAYLAVRRTNKETGVSYVFAGICLLQYAPKSLYDFGYKGLDESAGPNESECPERILKFLTPLDDPAYPQGGTASAKEWRDRCWKNIQRKKDRPKLKEGMRVRYPGGIAFQDGTRHEEFVVLDPKKYRLKADGEIYRLTRKLFAECEVIG